MVDRPKLQVPKDSPASAFIKNNSDIVSYEDLIVAQYLDDLKRSRHELKKFKDSPLSPYSQRFPNGAFGRRTRRRPVSASIVGRSKTTGKPKIDVKYIADHTLWDAATPRTDKALTKLSRPSSAPIKFRRPQSATSSIYSYGRHRPPSGRSKPLYKKQPHIIRVSAYKNGCKDTPVRAAASSIKMLLEFLTDKLGLPFAARRIFLEDGIEVFEACDIPTYSEVFISMGEPYKDPDESAKRNLLQRTGATWTLSGVNLLPEGKKKTTKAKMSKRMRSLTDKKKVRIIVYRNGNGNEPVEVVADLTEKENFLEGCTGRLNLTSHARILYDWDGNEITDLIDTPMVDDCLQTGGTPALGPLWVSIGDGFSPSGARDYIAQLIQILKKKLRDVKKFKTEIDIALNDDMDNVTIRAIKSMTPEELYDAQSKVENDVDQYKETLQKLKSKLENLEEKHQQEESYGASYRMTHIQEIPADCRLVGMKGLRLKVFKNGQAEGEHVSFFNLREAMKGIHGDKELLMKRLLDELSSSHWTNNIQTPKLNAIAQQIYDKFGHEITDVMQLKYDQEIWLSFGEAFITPFTYCLEASFDRATKADKEGVERVLREQIMKDDLEGKEEHSQWESTIGFPMLYEPAIQSLYADAERNDWLLQNAEIDSRGHYLIHKEKRDLVLYPEVAADEKRKRGNKDQQIWIISKSGYIYSRYMPQLCLGVSDTVIEGKLFDKDVTVEGPVVTLQKRQTQNPNQMWTFNVDGSISSQSHPEKKLTYIGSKLGDDESYNNNKPTGALCGVRVCLVICDALQNVSKKDVSSQRFAIKQEKFENLGQWKHTEASNPDFNKLAYSWPVKENGEINENYDWPMEGYIIPNAPPIRKATQKGYAPLRLMALKNGERDIYNAIAVVAPNMTNMMKDHSKKNKVDKKTGRVHRHDEDDDNSNDIDFQLHCIDLTLSQLEFIIFLDSCTSMLDLPFAARRLFDEKGKEHFSLKTVVRDQIVYITCGENWSDPKLTKEEQQKRHYLSQVAHDVNKIEQFCALRHPEKFVIEIEGNLVPNARVLINKEWNRDEHLRVSQSMEEKPPTPQLAPPLPPQQENIDTEEALAQMTARQRANLKSEQRLNALKWPWERLVNVSGSFDYEDPEAKKYTDKELYEKFKPKSSPRLSRDVLQTFSYEDGYIASTANRNLVLAVIEEECRMNDVLLVKRMPDDINQKWVMTQHGEIRSKCYQNLVLTVSMPSLENTESGHLMTFVGCPVILQTRRTNQFGKAHQRWHYDAESGLIQAFHTELPDKEITAANQADVCTFAIAQTAQIDQPGYSVEIPTKSNNNNRSNYIEIKVCISCARAMRGRYKITKLKANTPFSCAMGTAKKLRLKQIGSFRILNGKVDLSTHEAEITLARWQQKLENLQKEANASIIAKEISASRNVKNVKILAYKNGEGRLRPGEIICGSSIQGLLNQCMKRLGLNNAARRLYTEDGLIMLDIDDLIQYALENYKNSMVDKLEKMMTENGEVQVSDEEDITSTQQNHVQEQFNHFQERSEIDLNTPLQRAMQNIEQDEEDERGDNERGESERGQSEFQDPVENGQELTDAEHLNVREAEVDDKEAEKIQRRRDHLLSQIKLPTLDTILRYPIEIWVSSGKSFVPPEVVESKEVNRKKRRAFRAQVSLELDLEKHVLRQMKGRRIESQKPGEYRSTLSSKQPVVKEGNWEQPTVEEKIKHDTVNKLETHLNEIRSNQKTGSVATLNVRSTRKLYHTPTTIRVVAYPNGESTDRAVYLYGADMNELLENATAKLSLWKKAKLIYDEDGKQIKDFSNITRDQLLCISTGNSFKRPKNSTQDIEVKANWGRARKQYGPEATDLRVYPSKNKKVDVDPFGPPELALPVTIVDKEDTPSGR
ncbi:doublecortin domain-containing protein 1 [Patella vulgata]|uniref:doublecortin domain-containing protein 1 n=1 Tax=Patella vulgata TaxID=6465 RepID=UPI0021804AC2|nr:doublecortin domain-containing protein 1 [Patella vulgata]XP_050408825.1 doublecortin domain-containing protein 1 [Patella vulgata]